MRGEHASRAHDDGALPRRECIGADRRSHAVVRPGHHDHVGAKTECAGYRLEYRAEHGQGGHHLRKLRRVDTGTGDQVGRPTRGAERAVVAQGERHGGAAGGREAPAEPGIQIVHRLQIGGRPVVDLGPFVLRIEDVCQRRRRVQAVHVSPMGERGGAAIGVVRGDRRGVALAAMIEPDEHRTDRKAGRVDRDDRGPLARGAHDAHLRSSRRAGLGQCPAGRSQHRLPDHLGVLLGGAFGAEHRLHSNSAGAEDAAVFAHHRHLGCSRPEVDGKRVHRPVRFCKGSDTDVADGSA